MRLSWLVLMAIQLGAQSLNEDGIRIAPVESAYFVEPVRVTMRGPIQALDAEMAAAIAGSKGAPTAITVLGRTTISKPTVPTAQAEFETWLAPLGRNYSESIQAEISDTKWQDGKTTIERFVRDNFRRVYIHYAVTVEILPAGNYRATFAESTAPLPGAIAGDWKVISSLNFPVPQVLDDGDTITLELYTDGRTGQRIIEDIHFGTQTSIVLRKGAARQVYADDQLKLIRPRVRRNGFVQELGDPSGAPDGSVVWLYIPGEGRYVLSLTPHPELGFERAGELAGNSMRFVFGGNVFVVDCAERIADAGSGTYVLYALRDPGWEPADGKARARLGIGSLP